MMRASHALIGASVMAAAVAVPAAAPPAAPHRTTVNGVELAWVARGRGAPVVLVHGSGADLRTWGYQMEPFARAGFRAVAYSRRYHHPNAPPDDGAPPYSAALHAGDLAAFIHALGAGPAHVVASSYGAVVALVAAGLHPERLASLVLTEPAMLALLDGSAGEADGLARLESARSLLGRGDVEGALHAFTDVVVGPGAYFLMPASTRAMNTDNLPELRLEAAAPLGDPPDSCDDARRIGLPTLLITGEGSPQFFRRIADRLGECLPQVERVLVPGAAHAVHAQQPDRFNELVAAFLRKQKNRLQAAGYRPQATGGSSSRDGS